MIYAITCFAKCEKDNRGWFHSAGQRTFGFFHEKHNAIQALHTNESDMRECTYDFAVIEALHEGIHCEVEEEIWFQWDETKQGFYEIQKPDATYGTCNFALG